MVRNIITDLLQIVADNLRTWTALILGNMDLDLSTFNNYLPGFNVLQKFMLMLGLAAVIVTIVTEAFSLITSPFSGQDRKGGATTIIKCLIAGILVFTIYPLSMQVFNQAINPFYENSIEYLKSANYDVVGSDPELEKHIEDYISKHQGDMKYTPIIGVDGTPTGFSSTEYTEKELRELAKSEYAREKFQTQKKNDENAKKEFSNWYVETHKDSDKSEMTLYAEAGKIIAQGGLTETDTFYGVDYAIESLIELEPSIFATELLALLLIYIVIYFQFLKIVLSMVARYITFGICVNLSPMCMGFMASPATSIIPKSWAKTILAQVMLFFITAWGMNILYGSLGAVSETPMELILRLIFVYIFGKMILKMDELLNRLGFATMPTADNARGALSGIMMMGMMAARTFTKGGAGGGKGGTAPAGPNGKYVPVTYAQGGRLVGANGTSPLPPGAENMPQLKGGRIANAENYDNLTNAEKIAHDREAANMSITNGSNISASTLNNGLGIYDATGIELVGDAVPDEGYQAWTCQAKIPNRDGSYTDGQVKISVNGGGVYDINGEPMQFDDYSLVKSWDIKGDNGSVGISIHKMVPKNNPSPKDNE